jgi:putative ABC transport system ATP-binding protein
MIRFDEVTIAYDGPPILERVCFEITEGERVAFYGRSGSGKSTVLTSIVGAHIPRSGTVYFNGTAVDQTSVQKVRRCVSFIGQEPVLGAETIREALLIPFTYRANRGKVPSEEIIAETLQSLQLNLDILDRDAALVSGGEKQRIAIARALLLEKKIFLLDEITSALDVESKRAVLGLFTRKEYTIVSVSHDPDWFQICSRFLKIEAGRVVKVSDRPDPDMYTNRKNIG